MSHSQAHISQEKALQIHIRRILHKYAQEHLTTNHVDFTEQAVSEILSQCLRQVPLSDSYSLRPPTDPFDVLTRIYHLNSLPQFQETSHLSAEVQHFLRREYQKISSKTSQTKSERVAHDDNYDCKFPQDQFHLILSRNARNQTPKPGSNAFLSSLPKQPHKFLLSKPIKMKPISVNPMECSPLDRDKILNTTWNLTLKVVKDVNVLLRSTATLSFPGPSYKNQYLDPSARWDSPSPSTEDNSLVERDFTPLFPRTLRPGTGKTIAKDPSSPNFEPNDIPSSFTVPPTSMQNLALSSTEVSVFKEEEELYKQNLLLVNGWQTYNFSPTRGSGGSTPTPNSSQDSGSDQIDELFSRLSSPSTDPSSVADLPKLDVPAIPRCNRISGASSRPKIRSHGAGKSLAAFLLGCLPTSEQTPKDLVGSTEPTVVSDSSRARSTTTEATTCPGAMDGKTDHAFKEKFSDMEIKGLYQDLKEAPLAFILNEKLDHNTMMMEVPRLPPPNVHPRNDSTLQLPMKLSDLVVERNKENGSNFKVTETPTKNTVHRYGLKILKKPRGTQAATVALSWIPFNDQSPIPTHTEVTAVDNSQLIDRDDNKKGASREQLKSGVAALLAAVLDLNCTPSSTADDVILEVWERIWRVKELEFPTPTPTTVEDDIYVPDIVLTREERRRLLGMQANDSKQQFMGILLNQECSAAHRRDEEGRGSSLGEDRQETTFEKYFNFEEDLETRNSDKESDDRAFLHDIERPLKRVRMEDTNPGIDDSGISFDLDLPEQELFQTELAGVHQSNDRLDMFMFPYDETRDGTSEPLWNLEESLERTKGLDGEQNKDDSFTGPAKMDAQSPRYKSVVDGRFYSQESPEFHALCFDSQPAEIPTQNTVLNNISDHFVSVVSSSSTTRSRSRAESQTDLGHKSVSTSAHVDAFSPTIENHHISAGVAGFAQLRAKILHNDISPDAPNMSPSTINNSPQRNGNEDDTVNTLSSSRNDPSQKVFNPYTIQLSPEWTLPTSAHWYLASMSFVQKQSLVRCLRSETCRVGIVEREDLNGVDLILDPDTAIIFANLRALPSECDSLVTIISEQSWKYTRLLIVFEAYPPSWSFKPAADDSETLNVFTPPVLKFIKKLRRDLSIAESYDKKRNGCQVYDAFATDVEQAAKHARNFGGFAASRNDHCQAFWEDRSWLEEGEISEDEHGLAMADGMNHFAAFVVLYQTSVQELLKMSPEERVSTFGPQLGNERIGLLNSFIQQRLCTLRETDC